MLYVGLNRYSIKNLLVNDLIMIGILVFLARGWQNRPLIPSTPLLDLEPAQLPMAQNNIHTLFYSMLHKQEQVEPEIILVRPS